MFSETERRRDGINWDDPSIVEFFPNGDGVERDAMEKELILLVEDEPMLLELLKSVFEEDGFRIVTASDGEKAIEVFRSMKNEISLVLTDMGLPIIGGWELFEKLRVIDPSIKVILASGYVDVEMRDEALRKGAKDFVQKPYVPAIILQRIRSILDAA